MKKLIYTVIVIVIIITAALLFANPERTHYASYKDASYEIDGKQIVLGTDGTKYFGNEATGDLNGDGMPDAVFLFTYEPGGSGTFYYVVAALATDRGYIGTNAMLLGDRIAPQNTQIEEGDVIVNFADRRGDEPMSTSPSIGVTSYFKIVEGRLVYQGSR